MSHPKLCLLMLLVAYVALALQYNASAPLLGVRSDEQWHLGYVEYLQEHRALPVVDLEKQGLEGRPRWEPEGIQPPLYYWLVALATPNANLDDVDQLYTPNPHFLGTARGNRNPFLPQTSRAYATVYAGRLISLAFGVLALLSTYGLARAFASWTVALLATALTAFNPQFLYVSTSFSNDMAVTAICSLVIWFTARELGRPLLLRRAIVLGALIGLATLAKLSGFVLVGLVPATLLAHRLRQRGRSESTWRVIAYCGVLIALACLVPMPWFVRNWQVYGDPFALPGLYSAVGERQALIPIPVLYELLVFLWKGYWLDFSPGGILYGPSWVYLYYGILLLVSGGGLLIAWRKMAGNRPYLILASSWVLVYSAALLITMVQAQTRMGGGRLLFPVSSSVSVLVAVGILHLSPRRWKVPVTLSLTAVAIAFAIFAWTRILKPAYNPPRIPMTAAAGLADDGSIRLGDSIWLDGWEVGQRDVRPWNMLLVTLYWHRSGPVSKNYTVFLQLWPLGTGSAVAFKGVDSYPGLGLYPTSRLPTDEILVDEYPLPIIPASTVDEPIGAELVVGMYDRASGDRLKAFSGDRLLGDHVDLGRIAIRPSAPAALPENAQLSNPVVFGTGIQLAGARLRPLDGTEQCAELWWLGADGQRADLTVFLHALDTTGKVVAQADGPPNRGQFPTSLWKAGDLIRDRRCFSLPSSGRLATLRIGLYDPSTLTRLPAYASDGVRLTDDAAVLPLEP